MSTGKNPRHFYMSHAHSFSVKLVSSLSCSHIVMKSQNYIKEKKTRRNKNHKPPNKRNIENNYVEGTSSVHHMLVCSCVFEYVSWMIGKNGNKTLFTLIAFIRFFFTLRSLLLPRFCQNYRNFSWPFNLLMVIFRKKKEFNLMFWLRGEEIKEYCEKEAHHKTA